MNEMIRKIKEQRKLLRDIDKRTMERMEIMRSVDEMNAKDETKFEPRGIKQLPTPATRTQKSVKSQKRSRSAPAASKKGDRNDRSSTEGKSKLSPQSVASTLQSSLRRRSRSNTSRKQQQYPYPQKEVQNEQESKDAPRVSNVPGARPHRRSLSLVGNMSPQPQPKKKPSSPRGRSGSPRRLRATDPTPPSGIPPAAQLAAGEVCASRRPTSSRRSAATCWICGTRRATSASPRR